MDKENFDFLIFRIVVTVRDVELGSKDEEWGSIKSVLLHLSTYCSAPDGSRIFPGLPLLAKKTGYHEHTVRRALAVLIEEGWIQPETRMKGHIKGHKFVMAQLGLTVADTVVKRKPRAASSPPAREEADFPDYQDGLAAAGAASSPPPEEEESPARRQLREIREKRRQRAMDVFQL